MRVLNNLFRGISMNNQSNVLILKLDGRFGPLTRQQIEKSLQREFERTIKVESLDTNLEQHMDFVAAIGLVSAVCGIASFIMEIEEHIEKSRWTVPKINERILSAAIRVTGSQHLSHFRYVGINEFLSGKKKWCMVTIEIDDEDYRFYLERDGNTILIKLNSHEGYQIK
jgi:hypothetical protein